MQGRGRRVLLLAIGALAVPSSASAATSQFVTTKLGAEEPLAVRGASGSEDAQTLSLPPFTVSCAAMHAIGGPAPGYAALRSSIRFSRCTTTVSAGEQAVTVLARVKGAMELFYKGDGNANLVNPFEVQLPSLKCRIAITEGAQLHNLYTEKTGVGGAGEGKVTLPYRNLTVPTRNLRWFPGGYQQRLEIDNKQSGLSYSFAGACANLQPGVGTYSGVTNEEAAEGDLEFLPGSEWNQVENREEEGPGPGEEG